MAFTFGTRFACASRDFFFFIFIKFPYRHNKRAFFSRFYDITRIFIHTRAFFYVSVRVPASRLDKEGTKMGGGCENKAESVPPLPSLSFSKFRCNAKNGIQTNPKDKNQVSRGIKEALATNLPTKNLCYDIFPNYSSSLPFFPPISLRAFARYIKNFLKFTK